jgi:hypothetical protein
MGVSGRTVERVTFIQKNAPALIPDIKANGQQVPIELYKGQILDGRNRYRALLELGIEPQLRAYGGDDPRGHAISLNVRRRHLSPFDLGLLANTLKPKFEKAAAERMKATQATAGNSLSASLKREPFSITASASGRGPSNQGPTGKTSEQAAKILGVSPRTVERVAYISKYKPDLIPDIKDGLITIPQAVDKINAQEGLKRQHAARNDLNLSVVAGLKKTRSCHPHMDPHFLVLCGPYGVGIWTRQKTGFGG